MENLKLFATATFGVEALVAREIKHLGYEDTFIDNGKIFFTGDFEALCRANLWLRSAGRVYVLMGEFTATTFDDLFEATIALPWENWLPKDAEFPVVGNCVKSTLMSISDCQSIIKKAIVERLKKVYKLNIFPETGPRYRVDFTITKDRVILAMDSTGDGLHKRGYRSLAYTAPLKETLAAAMIGISRWAPGRNLIDPFCGSGTIPIEAALMAMDKAPGLDREFDCQKWAIIPKNIWQNVLDEARNRIKPINEILIQGYDINAEAVSMAQYHARKAGVSDAVHFQVRDMKEISSKAKYGFVITNPPYGERLGDKKENSILYKQMGESFKGLPTWSFYVINADPDFERNYGKKADKNRKLYNGGLLCYYYQYFGPKPARPQTMHSKE